MRQIIFSFILSILTLVLSAHAETILPGKEEYIARDCQVRPGERFAPTAVPACDNKIFCLNAFVGCKFIRGEAIRAGGDWEAITQRPNQDWIQLDTTVFCKMVNNSCNVDLDSCANQSASVAGCSMKKMPGMDWLTTIPREGAK